MKFDPVKRIARLKARIERINTRLAREDNTELFTEELKSREAELNYLELKYGKAD